MYVVAAPDLAGLRGLGAGVSGGKTLGFRV